jgi:hypothetical protein
MAALTLLQRQIHGDFVASFHRLQNNLNPRTIGLADVPPEIKRKFISDRGRFLLQIHPRSTSGTATAPSASSDLRSRRSRRHRHADHHLRGDSLMERASKQGTCTPSCWWRPHA